MANDVNRITSIPVADSIILDEMKLLREKIAEDLKKIPEDQQFEKDVINSNQEAIAKRYRQRLQDLHSDLIFSLKRDKQEFYISVLEPATRKIILEIPAKNLQNLNDAMQEGIFHIFKGQV